MIPKTLSATSGEVYEECPARFAAEYHDDRARQATGEAAGLGIVCHAVLQAWVQGDLHRNPPAHPIDLMKELYDTAYWHVFVDKNKYNEGLHLVQNWRARTDWTGHEVLTYEKRDQFYLKTTAGAVPFVYVMDRLDRLDTGKFELEVVDYKTVSQPITPDQLHDRIQARAYAVAAQVMYPEAERIWVTFDLLRFEQTVGTVFTKEENRDNWWYLKALAQRVVDDANPIERLNANCRWCVRRHVCKELQRHANAGGPLSITDPFDAAKKRLELDNAKRGIEGQINDLDELLLSYCARNELLFLDADTATVEVTASRRRNIDLERAARILGPELMLRYGDLKITSVDNLLKGTELTPEQKSELKGLVRTTVGEPRVKVSAKK